MRNRSGIDIPVPRVTGDIRRPAPVQVDDVRFLRAHTDRSIKITVPGPFTMAQQAQNDHYADDLPWPSPTPTSSARRSPTCSPPAPTSSSSTSRGCRPGPRWPAAYGAEALTRALEGAAGPVHVHLCFGYAAMVAERPEGYSFLPELADTPADAISVETAQSHLDPATLRPLKGKGIALGVLDLSTPEVETPQTIADRVRRALDDVDADKLMLSSDCGLKYLPRASAAGKMRSLAEAAALLRTEL